MNIQKRGDSSWFLTVNLGKDANGKYIRRTKTVSCRTKREAESEYAKFKIEVEAGEYIAPEKMTFAAFVEIWKEKYAVKEFEYKTLTNYQTNLKTRILPTFGHMQLSQVKTMHIVDFLDSLSKDGIRHDNKSGGLSTSSIQINHRILKNIFSRAVEWKLLKTNPVETVKKPKVTYKEFTPYEENEVREILSALQKEPIHWRMMITLALTTGLRRGELLGLEWKHIDWRTGVIEVVQSVPKSSRGIAVVKEPKNNSSKRKVALPAAVLEEMREYYLHRVKERDKIGDAWQGDDHFFMFGHADGRAYHHDRPYDWFIHFTKRNNIRYNRFHDLRHTSATILINQGVHAKIISERLGHSSINTTMNVYGHALRSADQSAADKFDNLFSAGTKTADKKTQG